ncbi:hypothetical protein F5144DRAFT_595577 [Chaetomium tenue]|uniref:Uncharacterized protein n=1 Tax=Chaetomium tenue TaxID=1854479 RepID=A0ACB7NYJ1_9PEZI|nr:hypothetical protein F5144DRAFT_595577 [Chaetomium globosum]
MPGPRGLTRHAGREHDGRPGGESHGPYLNRVIWSLAALSTVFLGLRVYSKILRRRQLWWDDYVLIASWTALVVSVTLQSVGVAHGLGSHYGDLDEESVTAVAIYSISAGFGSILATCWSKTSFAISLLRISTGRTRVFVWFIIVSVNLVMGSVGVIQWVQCWPVQKLWYYEMAGSCFPPEIVQNYNTFTAAYSGLMDIVLALLPWKIIWTITIKKRERLGAMVAMSTGVLAGVMAFLKIKTLYVIGNDDTTTVDLFIFGTAEPATAIMAASIPILRNLLRRESQPKPAEFIQLAGNGQQEAEQSPAPEEADNRERKQGARQSWARIAHLEQAPSRGLDVDRGRMISDIVDYTQGRYYYMRRKGCGIIKSSKPQPKRAWN